METTGILRLVNNYLNGTTATGDQFPGTSTNGYTNQPNQYAGQLGAFMVLRNGDAKRLSDPAAATLLGGRYQYVQFAADGTAYAAGQILYWKDPTGINYIVTNVPPSSGTSQNNIAGICLSVVTAGYYWFVQTDGVANVLFDATTQTAAGASVFSTAATPPAARTVTAATPVVSGGSVTSGTSAPLSGVIGVAVQAPTASTVSLVALRGICQVN